MATTDAPVTSAASDARAASATSDAPREDGVLRRNGIAECVRLRVRVDAVRLAAELDQLPADAWSLASRDPVVQASVESFFAVGYPRGPRPRPAEDRDVLARLPYLRRAVRELVPSTPTRAIVARQAPHGLIPIHTDTPRFFRETIRPSLQVDAGATPRLYCDGRWYTMAPGEVWAIDNLRPHGIDNPSDRPRLNVIADYLPTPELLALVRDGDRGLGTADDAATAVLQVKSRERYRRMRWRGIRYELWKRIWRTPWNR
jgi:hypothetical protein